MSLLSLFYGQNGTCGSKEPSHISFCFSHALKMFVGVYNLDGKIQCSLYFLGTSIWWEPIMDTFATKPPLHFVDGGQKSDASAW